MIIVLLCAIVSVGLVLLALWLRAPDCGDIPHIKTLPWLGHTVDMLKRYNEFNDWLASIPGSLPGNPHTFCFSLSAQPLFVMTTDPRNVEYILKTNFSNYIKGSEFYERFGEMLGHGIFNVDGEEWKIQRKTASRMFNVKNFRDSMIGVFANHTEKLEQILCDAADSGTCIDLQNYFHRLTLDSIGDVGFGWEINSMTGDSAFSTAFDGCQARVNERFLSPFWRIEKALNLPAEKTFSSRMVALDEFARTVVRTRGAESDEELENKRDLLSIFLSRRDANGQRYPEDFLRDLIMNFTIAGRDTTAQALSWLFYEVCRHPEVEEKIVAEINNVLGGEHPTYATLKELRYIHAAFSEALRLHPPVPNDSKMAVEDDVWPDGTRIKKGSWATYSPYIMGRRKELWGEDACEFRPERWMDDNFNPSPFKFVVFQAGPRTCLGQNMAYIEGKTVAAMLYTHFTFRLKDPKKELLPQTNVTLPIDGGLPLYVSRRK